MKAKRASQKFLVLVIALMITIIPSMGLCSFGKYHVQSQALTASTAGNFSTSTDQQATWWAAAAAAIVAAWSVGYVVGTVAHHAYDLLGGHEEAIAVIEVAYDPTDFSKFDN
ncbi:MAG TPA: hypothetical protein VD927_00520 [Chryseosolibacter sp.]|nr:hypothetical protein [Chryseosolibacter sp.]